MKFSTLTPELRTEAATAAASLKTVIAAARVAGAEHLRLAAGHADWRKNEAGRHLIGSQAGLIDSSKAVLDREKAVAQSEPDGQKTRLIEACNATHPVQIKVFNFVRAQIDAAVKEAVAPFFTAGALAQLPFTTEIEQRVNGLAMRLRLSRMQTFVESLRQAELTCQVLEDFAAGREVFTLEPAEVPAAA